MVVAPSITIVKYSMQRFIDASAVEFGKHWPWDTRRRILPRR